MVTNNHKICEFSQLPCNCCLCNDEKLIEPATPGCKPTTPGCEPNALEHLATNRSMLE